MNSNQQLYDAVPGGHALSVERVIDAPAEVIFDALIAMYDSQRPDWVTGSRLDLRPGGRWTVDFQVPGGRVPGGAHDIGGRAAPAAG